MSPASQPQGLLISQFPVAASFANPAAFQPVSAGPLGGEFLIRASRLGGPGGDTIDQPDGKWCGYWHQQSGSIETFPRGGRVLEETGDLGKISLELRGFLGELAGSIASAPSAPPLTTSIASTGLINISTVAMQPIKLGSYSAGEEGVPLVHSKNVLEEDDTREEKDTVLLSRGECSQITMVELTLHTSQRRPNHHRS